MSIVITEIGIFLRDASIRRPLIWQNRDRITALMDGYLRAYPDAGMVEAFTFALQESGLNAH
jgi:hypothetical protein